MPGRSISGLSWLAVLVIARDPSGRRISQAQPEPKRSAAARAKRCCRASGEPKAAVIAAASSGEGAPPWPGGAITRQKREWL